MHTVDTLPNLTKANLTPVHLKRCILSLNNALSMHIKEENFSFLALKTFLIALQKCPNFSKKQDAFLKKLPPAPPF